MRKSIFFLILLVSSFSVFSQDFMLQGWYWDYDKDGCNGFSGPNWASTLDSKTAQLESAGFSYVWLPPLSRASFGQCSNGYDPKDLYDLGDSPLGRTGFGTRSEVDAVIANLKAAGISSVADVVYNHRDGGDAEDNPAVKAYIETHFNGNGKQPFPSDRYRYRLPLGGAYSAGQYFIKISSKTQSYGSNEYRFRATVASTNVAGLPGINENEPNGGGDCGQPNNDVALDQDLLATLFDFSGCYTDEFRLVINAADFDAGGDDLYIFLTNTNGYSDHRIYDIYYAPASGAPGFNIPLSDLKIQTYTDFSNQPSGLGSMNFENFRPNSSNTSTTFLAGDFDSPIFFYDVVQEEASTASTYNDWTNWLLSDPSAGGVGIGGLRMDAVKHFPPSFISQLLDDLASRGKNPEMVVGEFFDGNSGLLKSWVDQVSAGITQSTATVRVFDFSLRNALKEACDNGSYDLRNVFNSSLYDNGLSGFNVVTFLNNHDFRKPGEPIQNDPLLGYAYLLTNNQLGVPTIFYPDFFGTTIPNAPTVNLESEISTLMEIHRNHIFGAPTVEYLNRFSSPYTANYQSGSADKALIYQISGGAGATEVVVAINFSDVTLKVNQEINLPINRSSVSATDFEDLTGNAFNTTATTNASNQLLIDVPARSYAVYASTQALPVELVSFDAELLEKGQVLLEWKTSLEEALLQFTPEVSTDGQHFTALPSTPPNQRPSTYQVKDDRPWVENTRYYRLKTLHQDGTESFSPVRQLTYQDIGELQIHPNPVKEQLYITGGAKEEPLVLFAADGRQLDRQATFNGNRYVLNLNGLPPGIYWLRAGPIIRKVVKQ